MGKKNRKKSRVQHDDSSDEEHEAPAVPIAVNNNKDWKDLDFAQRRDLQRQQAAEKRRAKLKCFLCNKTGHVRRECPGIMDDGRGMSRFKGKSNVKHEKNKYQQAQKQGATTSLEADGGEEPALPYPESLHADLDFVYYDVSCDIAESLLYCQQGRGKYKSSPATALEEYQQAIRNANAHTNFGGMICQMIVGANNQPWKPPEGSPLPDKTWYSVGLHASCIVNDGGKDNSEDETTEACVQLLLDAVANNPNQVVGVWAQLEDTQADQNETTRLVQITCKAAALARVTMQIQLGGNNTSSALDEQQFSVLHAALKEAFQQYPTNLKIILIGWTGQPAHMLQLLHDFPQNLFIGMDGAVGFSKATHLHECAFEVPLNRLVLSTSCTIPSDITKMLGRDAFFHSGLWPFVAQSVAQYKRHSSLEEVAREVSALTIQLYPQLAVARREQPEVKQDFDSKDIQCEKILESVDDE